MSTAVNYGKIEAQPGARRTSLAFWIVAATFFLYLFANSAPTPLYDVYAAQWNFSPAMLTVVFGVYAVTFLATLLLAGSLSDGVGRRPVLLAALIVQILAMALFLVADNVGWLLAARLVQGCATGLVTATVAAALVDLHPPGRPALAPLMNGIIPPAGLAVGALVSGALVQYAIAPTRLIYWIMLAGFVASFAALLRLVPETVSKRHGMKLGSRVRVERSVLKAFLATVPVLVAVWALASFYLSLGPSLVFTMQHSHNALLGGAADFVFCGSGAVAEVSMHRVQPRKGMRIGALLLAGGVILGIVSVASGISALFYVGTVIAGAGFGIGFLGAFRTLASLAVPERRSELLAAVYVVAYLSFSVPAVIAGVVTTYVGLRDTAIGLGVIVTILAVAALPATMKHCRDCNPVS